MEHKYDDELFVTLAAQGHTAAEIAERVGLCADYVRRILRGRAFLFSLPVCDAHCMLPPGTHGRRR